MENKRPYPPQKVAQAIKQRVGRFSGEYPSKGMQGVLIGLLNDICGGDEGRYVITEYLFGKVSSKELTENEWFALRQWIQPTKEFIAGKDIWTASPFIQDECFAILEAMGYNYSKREILIKRHSLIPKEIITVEGEDDLDRAIQQATSKGCFGG